MLLTEHTKQVQLDLAEYCRTGEYKPLPGITANRVEHYRRLVFNVVKNTDLSGSYRVQLVAYDPGEPRNGSSDTSYGSVLAQISGTAILSDVAAAADGFTFTADEAHADLGKLLGIRIRGGGTIDNLKVTWVPPLSPGTVITIW